MSNLDFAELQGELERSKQKQTGASDYLKMFVSMPQSNGFVIVRLLPPAAKGMFGREKSPFYVATRTHRLRERSYHCLCELEGKKWVGECPVCQYCRYLWKKSEEAPTEDMKKKLQDLYRQIKAVERFYFACIARYQINRETNQAEKDVGPLILSVGQKVKDKIFTGILGNPTLGKKPLGDVTDINAGRDYKIVKVMTQGAYGSTYPTYDESQFEDPSPLGSPEQVEQWLTNIPDLVSLRRLLTPDELKHHLKVHLGVEKDEETNFDPSEYEPQGGGDEAEAINPIADTTPPFQSEPSGGNGSAATAEAVVSDVVAQVAEATGEKPKAVESDFFASLKKHRAEKAAK